MLLPAHLSRLVERLAGSSILQVIRARGFCAAAELQALGRAHVLVNHSERQPSIELTQLKPGEGIRWAVGSPNDLRSSTWRFWGNKKGDFYLSVRALGGIFKTSLHKDRQCQTGFTSEHWLKAVLQGNRHIDRWELTDAPSVKAFQVVIPYGELSLMDIRDKEPMKWLPTPALSNAAVVTVFIVTPDYFAKRSEAWPGAVRGADLIGLATTNLRSAFLVASEQELNRPMRAEIDAYRQHLRQQAAVTGRMHEPGVRALLGGGDGVETHYMVEISLDTQMAAPPA